MEAAAALGAGLDWKTSLQELSAERGLGVPEYVIQDEGPDHVKTFTAQVRVGDGLYGHGIGRSKKEAEQQAAETAYGELSASDERRVPRSRPRVRRRSPDRRPACLSCPRSRSSARGLETPRRRRHPIDARARCCILVRSAVTSRGPADFAAALTGRRVRRRPPARQVPLARPRQRRRPARPPRHERADARAAGRRTRRAPPAGRSLRSSTARLPAPSCASSTSGCSAAWWSPRAAPSCRRRSRTSRVTRSTRSSTTTAFVRRGPQARVGHQAAAARPDPRSPASATSTPTRRCGGRCCTASADGDKLRAAEVARAARPRSAR